MKRKKSQQGMTTIGWLMVLVILGLFLIIGIKLVPVYVNGYSLYSAMESMESNHKLRGMSARQLRKKTFLIIDLNYIRDIKPEDVIIARKANGYQVAISYVVYRHILGNLSLYVEWDKTVLIPLK